jgi:hypothetical protein
MNEHFVPKLSDHPLCLLFLLTCNNRIVSFARLALVYSYPDENVRTGGVILVVPARTDHKRKNTTTGYDHRIPASIFWSFPAGFCWKSMELGTEIIVLDISFCLFNWETTSFLVHHLSICIWFWFFIHSKFHRSCHDEDKVKKPSHESLKKEEVVSRQLVLKFSSTDQKKKTNAIVALEVRLKKLSTRFENHEINRKQYLLRTPIFCGQ